MKNFFKKLKDKLITLFVYSRFATLKRLSKLNKRYLWEIYLKKNYNAYSYKVNVNKWLPDYLINHADYVYGIKSEVQKDLRDKTFELAIKTIYNCEILEYIPVHVIIKSNFPVLVSYFDWTSNSIDLRLFAKLINVNKYEIKTVLDSEQIKRVKDFNIDLKNAALDASVTELSNYINNTIIDLAFKLGSTNAKNVYKSNNLDLNLFFGKDEKSLSDFSTKPMLDINGDNIAENWEKIKPIDNDDTTYIQRKIVNNIISGINAVATTSRLESPNILITNTFISSILMNNPNFVANNLPEEINNYTSLYKVGNLNKLTVLCDPNMDFNDTRICLGYTGNLSKAGIHIAIESILANPKITIEENNDEIIENSANIDIMTLGNQPEIFWYTFAIDSEYDIL